MKRALLGSILLHVLLLGALALGFHTPPTPQPLQLVLQKAPSAGNEKAAEKKATAKTAATPPKSMVKAESVKKLEATKKPAAAPLDKPLAANAVAAKPESTAPAPVAPATAATQGAAAAATNSANPAPAGGHQGGQANGAVAEKTGSSKEVRVRLAPKPEYPALSRELGEEGTVWLQVDVDQAGMPTRIQLARSSGFVRLDRAAKQGVAAWRFDPARQDGQAQPSRIELPVRFSLKE